MAHEDDEGHHPHQSGDCLEEVPRPVVLPVAQLIGREHGEQCRNSVARQQGIPEGRCAELVGAHQRRLPGDAGEDDDNCRAHCPGECRPWPPACRKDIGKADDRDQDCRRDACGQRVKRKGKAGERAESNEICRPVRVPRLAPADAPLGDPEQDGTQRQPVEPMDPICGERAEVQEADCCKGDRHGRHGERPERRKLRLQGARSTKEGEAEECEDAAEPQADCDIEPEG